MTKENDRKKLEEMSKGFKQRTLEAGRRKSSNIIDKRNDTYNQVQRQNKSHSLMHPRPRKKPASLGAKMFKN